MRDEQGNTVKTASGANKRETLIWTYKTPGCPYKAEYDSRDAVLEAMWMWADSQGL